MQKGGNAVNCSMKWLLLPVLVSSLHCIAQTKLEFKPSSLDKPVQPSQSFARTIYYDADWHIVKLKKDAVYYREPVIKDGSRYELDFYRMDRSKVKTAYYLPVIVNYQLVLDDGLAIKDSIYIAYDVNGNKEMEGNYDQNKKVGEWKYYNNGVLTETREYRNDTLINTQSAQ